MDRDVKEKVREWLDKGEVDVFLGYRMVKGHPLPYCFQKERLGEVDDLVGGPARYPLEKLALGIQAVQPEIRIGLLARDCNRRAVNILVVWKQADADSLRTLDVACCPSPLKKHVDCSYLAPEKSGPYKEITGIDNQADMEELEGRPPEERFKRWMYEFQKCIKCYGCRNICPVCFCKECGLEHPDLVGTGDLPPEVPVFHLVRAIHMAGRCIDCGLCEEACPMDIPLRLLYRKVNEIVKRVFDYEAGTSPGQSPFHALGDKVLPEAQKIEAA